MSTLTRDTGKYLAEDMLDSDHAVVGMYHEQMGFDYKMPDLDSHLFVIKKVVRDEQGIVLGAAGLRVQAETYLWLDTALPVRVRLGVVLALGHSCAEAAWRVGLDCLVAWLPPSLPKSFKKALNLLGWNAGRSDWESWSKSPE